MRSVTSFFNSALYRKTMARFWPLWALYGLLWLFILPLRLLNEYFYSFRGLARPIEGLYREIMGIPALLSTGVLISALFGILCAMAVFGYLYNNRSACMMHALPMRRETLFTTQYLAGVSFFLLPHLVVGLLTMAIELALLPTQLWAGALTALGTWFLVQTATTLFFFSFAAFCAMFTGHILALPAFYGIFNCLVAAVYALLTELMRNFFYGFVTNGVPTLVKLCTPAYALWEGCDITYSAATMIDPNMIGGTVDYMTGTLTNPGTIAGYTVAGLLFAGLALLVYRRRHVESAGDVVSLAIVRPLFQYGVSFCSGLCFGVATAAFFDVTNEALALALFVLLWAAIGFFVAEMLLKKSFRVFHAWKGCLVMVVAMALLCTVCFLDVFGVTKRVPSMDQVAEVDAMFYGHYPSDSGHYYAIDIAQLVPVLDLHQAVVNDIDRLQSDARDGDNYVSFRVNYTLKDGTNLSRAYHSLPVFEDEVGMAGSVTHYANQLTQNKELIDDAYNFAYYETGRLVEASLVNLYNKETDHYEYLYLERGAQALWQAVQKDFDEGTLGVRYLFDNEERLENTYITDLEFSFLISEDPRNSLVYSPTERTYMAEAIPTGEAYYDTSVSITLTPHARHTLAVLEELDVFNDTRYLVLNSEHLRN